MIKKRTNLGLLVSHGSPNISLNLLYSISRHASPDECDTSRELPIHWAARAGRSKNIEVLVKHAKADRKYWCCVVVKLMVCSLFKDTCMHALIVSTLCAVVW